MLSIGDGPGLRVLAARAVAIGWATVELDRAAADLATAFGVLPAAFEPAPRSVALGCACLVAAGILADGASLALVEPDTEGRLAADLARFDEGPAIAWLRLQEPAAVAVLRMAGLEISAERGGPFGPESLVVDGLGRARPLRLLVRPPAGTIRP